MFNFKRGNSGKYRSSNLIADIGGTNARFAVVDPGSRVTRHERTLKCANYHTLLDAILAYLDDVSLPVPDAASLAIATPVSGDRIIMTNHSWDLSVQKLRADLGIHSLKILNDYAALALALPYLDNNDYYKLGSGNQVDKQTIAVIGPGTGLGVSGVVYVSEHWFPLQSEGGHISYGPLNDREAEVISVIRKHYDLVSAESLVSGPGLVLLYQSIAKCDDRKYDLLSPAQVSERALNQSDSCAVEAVDMFCGILGSISSNLALTLGARGGVYIGGGIVPKLGELFLNSAFRDRFESSQRFGQYLSEIPTYVITSKYPALTGAAVAFEPQYASLGVTSIHKQAA